MRLPETAHTAQPWRIHELAPDFAVEDVWALPTPGGPDDFPRLVELVAEADPEHSGHPVVRALFALRWKLGALLGWDDERRRARRAGADACATGCRPTCARARPARQPTRSRSSPLYLTGDEFAAEIANRDDARRDAPRRGSRTAPAATAARWPCSSSATACSGGAYMAAIKPFRHLIVYPLMMRDLERRWRARAA